MPLRFCKIRWTENVPVVGRTVDMLPKLCQCIKVVNENEVPYPQTRIFGVLKETCRDPLIAAALSFYRCVGKTIQSVSTRSLKT